MLFWLWHYLGIKIDIYQVHNELCILKSSKNSSIYTTLKIQDAGLLRVCTACVQIRISQVHGCSGGKSMQLQLYLCWVKKWRDQSYHHFVKFCQLFKNARLFDLSRTGGRYQKSCFCESGWSPKSMIFS